MKKYILTTAFAVTGLISVQAQNANDTFIKIESDNIFSQCFDICDTNKDGIVTYAEAAAATKLGLDRGGRSNVIENYDFLKYFPNLEMFSVGNTPLEVIDLHMLKKLKLVNVSSALWLKKLIFGCESAPEITGQDPTREPIKVEAWVEEDSAAPQQTESTDFIVFKDDGIRDFCIDWLKTVDTNKDKQVTVEEAAAVKELSLMCFKSFIRFIKNYDDLKYFPNLEYFHAGTSYAETVDLSACKKLKEVDLSDCRMLKKIILAKGCKPTIKYPVAYKGEQAKVEYK